MLYRRFERRDLDASERAARAVVQSAAPDHPGPINHLGNLANALQARYTMSGDLASLTEAIQSVRTALELIPVDHGHDRAPSAIWALRERYERTGRRADAAIVALTEAVSLVPRDKPLHRMLRTNLGSTYRARFERDGDLRDLDAAIGEADQALALTPSNADFRATGSAQGSGAKPRHPRLDMGKASRKNPRSVSLRWLTCSEW